MTARASSTAILSAAALGVALYVSACGSDEDPYTPPVTTGGGGQGGSAGSGGEITGGGGQGGTTTGGGGQGGGGGDMGPWERCPMKTEGTGDAALCATFEMPAFHDDPGQGTVHVFVRRYRALQQPRRGGVFLLSGGPGQGGEVMEGVGSYIQAYVPDLDIFIPDHRGTGRSDRLSCPTEEDPASDENIKVSLAELPACVAHLESEWGDLLPAFNGTEAAHDLGTLMDLLLESSEQGFLYGVSYGSQLGHRYLQLYPDQAAGVAIDSLCVPQCYFTEIDDGMNDVAHTYLDDRCKSDPLCSGKLGADPWAFVNSVLTQLGSGHCPALDPRLTVTKIKAIAGELMTGAESRKIVPALFYRLDRCSADDRTVLSALADRMIELEDPIPVDKRHFSRLLTNNVAMIDNMPEVLPTVAELQALVDGYTITDATSVEMREVYDLWPVAPKDAYHGEFATTATPMLMLHGELDFIPVSTAQPLSSQFTEPNQTLVIIPNAPHSSYQQSLTLPWGHCTADVLHSFLTDPTVAVDQTCLAELAPINFEVHPNYSWYFLATSDAYEGDYSSVRSGGPTKLEDMPEWMQIEIALIRQVAQDSRL